MKGKFTPIEVGDQVMVSHYFGEEVSSAVVIDITADLKKGLLYKVKFDSDGLVEDYKSSSLSHKGVN